MKSDRIRGLANIRPIKIIDRDRPPTSTPDPFFACLARSGCPPEEAAGPKSMAMLLSDLLDALAIAAESEKTSFL